ncbi:MAG TPA: hypothetical protein VH415_02425 [Nitrososphaeraceae archaeon]|jgi:hypothetical protein
MQKIMISAPDNPGKQLEEKLRHRFDVTRVLIENHRHCEISAKIRNKWVPVCRFVAEEELKDILTMFEVNLELKKR